MSKFTRISAALLSYALQARLETLIIDFPLLSRLTLWLILLDHDDVQLFFSLENYDAAMLHIRHEQYHFFTPIPIPNIPKEALTIPNTNTNFLMSP